MSRWSADDYQKWSKEQLSKRLDKKSKYSSNPTEYNGVKYASKKEANYAGSLDLLKRANAIKEWEREPRFIFHAYGERITTYKIDFKIIHNDNSIEYVEIKGGKSTQTQVWKIRWKFLKAYLKMHEPESKLTLKE